MKGGKIVSLFIIKQNHVFGYHGGIDDGASAEYTKFPVGSILPVERATIGFADTVVISGTGSIGLCMLQVAKLKPLRRIIALDTKDNRLKVAKNLGADITINVGKEDVAKAVMDLTDGYGCDVYIEAAGHPDSVKQGLQMLRNLGTYVEFGVSAQEASLDWSVVGD